MENSNKETNNVEEDVKAFEKDEEWIDNGKEGMWSDYGSDSEGEPNAKRIKFYKNREQPEWWNAHLQQLRGVVFRSRRKLQRARRRKESTAEDIDMAFATFMHDLTVFNVAKDAAKGRLSKPKEKKIEEKKDT